MERAILDPSRTNWMLLRYSVIFPLRMIRFHNHPIRNSFLFLHHKLSSIHHNMNQKYTTVRSDRKEPYFVRSLGNEVTNGLMNEWMSVFSLSFDRMSFQIYELGK